MLKNNLHSKITRDFKENKARKCKVCDQKALVSLIDYTGIHILAKH